MHFCQFSIALVLFCFLAIFSAGGTIPTQPKVDISVNCGSSGSFVEVNGREWIGDNKHPKFGLQGISTGLSAITKLITSDNVIYKTARISYFMFSYSFHLNPGQKIIRLHFNPSSYKGFKRSNDFFTVEAGPFTLMSNCSASLIAQGLGVNTFTKEFYISIEENQPLIIFFSPANIQSRDRTYAFVNGIEIISVPLHLNYFHERDHGAKVVGRKFPVYIDNNTALEIIHQLNVKRESHMSGDEFDALETWATVPKQKANEISNLTWKRLVDIGFRYLVRIHFFELGLKLAETGHVMFNVLIDEMIVDIYTDIVKERNKNGGLSYRDYLVVVKGRKQDGQRGISISLQSNNDLVDKQGLLKGFEIFKLSNHDNNLASPNPLPPARILSSSIIQNLQLSHRNVISTIAITMVALVSISVHMLRLIFEANIQEEENKPSARAKKLCRCFSLAELRSATKNFSDVLLIGRGGFGEVYKGFIDNGLETVAIKRLQINSNQGKREFLTEIETLCELRHINLVSLIGYCNESKEMILVYEYMTSGTLADHLYKHARHNNGNISSLTWKQRLNICIGAGRGLDFLHTGHRVIHRDVKPSNILLDENFVAKVSDFGLAKPEDKTMLQSHVSTNVKGTPGYFDPHYINTRRLTRKSDTYAFGVVLFQVLCEKPAMVRTFGEEECYLTKWARNKISMGEVDQIVASSLKEEISPDSLKVFVEIAENCLHDEPKKRPTMAQVVVQLEFALEKQENKILIVPNQEKRVSYGRTNNKMDNTVVMECKKLLLSYSKPVEPERLFECLLNSMRPSSGSPGDFNGKIPSFHNHSEHNVADNSEYTTPNLIPPRMLPLLHDLAEQIVQAGNQQQLQRIYRDIRSQVLEEILRKLGVEKLSKEDVQKMQWEVLEAKIGNWIYFMRIAIKLLFAGERKVCDQIFEGFDSLMDQCFSDVTYGSVAVLLSLGDAMAKSKHSPEKLFVLLDMCEIMQELHLEIEALFRGKACNEIRECALRLTKRLAQTAQDTFGGFEEAIEKDATKLVADGTVHPLTRYVVNYVIFLFEYQSTLKQLFPEFKNGDSNSQLAAVTMRIMEALQTNLDVKSKQYSDTSLTHLFLMNNIHYMIRTVRKSEAKDLLGDDWVQRHRRTVQHHANQYKRIACANILQSLSFQGLTNMDGESNSGVLRGIIKDRLKTFNIQLEELHQRQSQWTVPDTDLRESLRLAVAEVLLPAYRSFIKLFEPWWRMAKIPRSTLDTIQVILNL